MSTVDGPLPCAVHVASVKFSEWHHQPSLAQVLVKSQCWHLLLLSLGHQSCQECNWSSSGFGSFFITPTLDQYIFFFWHPATASCLFSQNSLESTLPPLLPCLACSPHCTQRPFQMQIQYVPKLQLLLHSFDFTLNISPQPSQALLLFTIIAS